MVERLALLRLRAFLHLLALAMFLGTIGELLAAKHYDSTMQLVPFVLCVVGFAAVIVEWWRPSRGVIRGVRALMIAIAAGSLLGVYEHLEGNYGFVTEVRPHATIRTLIEETLTGRAPFMAPGILAIAASIAIAATCATSALRASRKIEVLSPAQRPQRVASGD